MNNTSSAMTCTAIILTLFPTPPRQKGYIEADISCPGAEGRDGRSWRRQIKIPALRDRPEAYLVEIPAAAYYYHRRKRTVTCAQYIIDERPTIPPLGPRHLLPRRVCTELSLSGFDDRWVPLILLRERRGAAIGEMPRNWTSENS